MAAPMKMRLLRNICQACRNYSRQNNQLRFSSTAVAVNEEIDTETVEYPPIKPRYPPGNWGHLKETKAWEYYEFAQSLNQITDVRERLEKLAEKKVLIYKTDQIYDTTLALTYQQYITKTHLIQGLPDVYDSIDVENELGLLKPVLMRTILQQDAQQQMCQDVDEQHESLARYVNDVFSALAGQTDHLRRAQLDEKVTVKSFWWRYGFDLDKKERGQDNNWILRTLSTVFDANLQIRTELPLPQLISLDSDACTKGTYPDFPYQPSVLGRLCTSYRPMSISGHWIQDPCEFVHTSFHSYPLTLRSIQAEKSAERVANNILGNGIINLFASTLAQAYNQGFNMYQDITYPLTSQSVISDGRTFTFLAYQLNTIHLWLKDEHQPLRNVCWASQQMALYDRVENGEVHGFNDDVLRTILKFLKLQPEDRGIDLRPNLQEKSPALKKEFINKKGTPVIPSPVIGRFQYPRDAVYF